MLLINKNKARDVGPPARRGASLRRASALTRWAATALGIVVVLGKGTRGSEPAPTPAIPAPQTIAAAPEDPTATPPEAPVAAPSETPSAPPTDAPAPVEPPPSDAPDPAGTASEQLTLPSAKKKKAKSPWRGSEIAYRNSVTAISFDASSELTYNPFWGMAVELSPRYSFGDVWSVGASLEIQREITEADDTTRADETQLGDLSVRVGASNFAKIPVVGIDLSASLGFAFPTSLASQGNTMLFSVSPSLRLSRTFDKLNNLTFGYSARFTKAFHEYTTSELASPVVPGCFVGSSGSCDRLLNTGYRNASYRMSNGFDVSIDLTSWLSASADISIIVSWLYDDVDDERVSHVELEPTDERYAVAADLGLSARWWKPLEVRLGASTFNPQLRSDGERYAPFFNRFTTLYLDLRLDVAALVQDLTEEN